MMSDTANASDDMFDNERTSPGFSIWPVVWRRWPYLVLGLLVGVGVGFVIHATGTPAYQASAQVLVLKKRNELIKDNDIRTGSVDDYVGTQVTLIKSEKIRLSAAQKARGFTYANPLPTDDLILAGMIGAGLTIVRDKDASAGPATLGSSVLNLTMTGSHPEDCRKLLQSVIFAHQAELFTIYDKASQDKLQGMDKLMEVLKQQRKVAGEQKIVALSELRNITSEEVPSIRSRVSTLRTQQSTFKSELVELNDQIDLITKTGSNSQDRQLTLAQLTAQLRPVLPQNPTNNELARSASPLRLLEAQQRELTQTVGLGKDHPRVKAIESQIAVIKEEIERPVGPGGVAIDELGAYGKWAEQKRKTTLRQLQQVEEQLKTDEQVLKLAGGLQDRIDALTMNNLQQENEIKRLEAEKLTTQATQGAGGYTLEPITPPANGKKVAPVFFRSIATGIMIGLLLGVGTVVLIELNDKSFRSPAEIRQRLGIPVIGHVPFLGSTGEMITTASHIDPSLLAFHKPSCTQSEAYRGLRTQLFFSTQGRGHQVIQVTSPTPGDGKSTTAANLAVTIAQTGKRTVLLDCDFRKPRVHKLFGLTTEAGLANVIAGVDRLDDAIQPSGLANLDILPCGVRPANPAELLSSPHFQDVLKSLRERYEFVIVDTPPVLAVTDPAIVAPRVDGVVLVFRLSKKIRPTAEWARETLAAVGANTIGVVINASDQQQRGYGYGYQYGYGYKYGYNYGVNYSEEYSENAGAA